MPITDVIVVCAIISAFAIFAVALAWGDYQTREIARVSRERAAAGATIVALKRPTTTETAERSAQKKTTASAA